MLLCLALALHVLDETLTNFLVVYNPTAMAIRGVAPWLPVPVFQFETWIAGLILLSIGLMALSPFAFRGSRWLRPELQTERQPLLRQIYGRIFNLFLRIMLGLNFRDTQCGFKAFRKEAAQQIFPLQRIERWGFDPEILYLARRLGFRSVEVPVRWAHSAGTRLHPLRDGIRMGWEVLHVRWYAWTGKYDREPTPGEGA